MNAIAAPVSIRVPVQGGALHLETRGVGPPVMFLHGISANRSIWNGVIAELAPTVRVVLPDLLGRGESVASRSARYRLQDETHRLREAAHSLNLERPLVVGHSQGAAIAAALSTVLPVRGLLLISPVSAVTRPKLLLSLRIPGVAALAAQLLPLFRRTLTRYILERRVYADADRADVEAVERYAHPYRNPERARSLLRALADWRPEELLSIQVPEVPMRVLSGARDRRITPAVACDWASLLGAPCSILPDCGHGLPEEAAGTVARNVEELLAGTVGGKDAE